MKKSIALAIGATILASLALALPACNTNAPSGGGAGGKPYVAFISNNSHEFWTIAEKGAKDAAAKFDVQMEFRMPTQGVADQHRIIEDLQSKGVQAIAVSPNDSANQVGYYKSLNKKLPVIAVDNDIPDPDARRCYLGTDNVAAGRAVGKLVKQSLPNGGKFMIFVGRLDSQNAQERRQGVVIELAGGEDKCAAELEQLKKGEYPIKFGPYELLDTRTDLEKQDVCQSKAEDALANIPDLACLIGLWAYNPPAMLRAAESQKRLGKVVLIGFDENPETLSAVRAGTIAGTVVQDPYNFGYESVKIMAAIVRGDANALKRDDINAQKQIYIRHRIINKDGKPGSMYQDEKVEAVDPFEINLNKLKGK